MKIQSITHILTYRGKIEKRHVIGEHGLKSYRLNIYRVPVGSKKYTETILDK